MIDSISRLRRFMARIKQRFVEENFDQISASLAFTTLLSLVPLVALMLSMLTVVPFFSAFVERLDLYVVRQLLPSGNAGMISTYVLQFSHKAANVGLIGAAVLVATVGFLLLSIEHAFNHVWSVASVRPWWKRLRLYGVLLALWPLVVGAVVVATSYAVTTSLGFVDEPRWLGRILYNVMGVFVTAVFLGGLYWAVPFTRVAMHDAAWAGLFAALGFLLMQKTFEIYLANFPSYTAVYGAFATVPIFMLWLYLSWAVILIGALVAVTLPEFRQEKGTDPIH